MVRIRAHMVDEATGPMYRGDAALSLSFHQGGWADAKRHWRTQSDCLSYMFGEHDRLVTCVGAGRTAQNTVDHEQLPLSTEGCTTNTATPPCRILEHVVRTANGV